MESLKKWPLKRRCETIARFWGLHWSAIQLVILRDHGGESLAKFKYQILRTHQRSHFLEGVDKLGIIGLYRPPSSRVATITSPTPSAD